jgi:hypothetical protein
MPETRREREVRYARELPVVPPYKMETSMKVFLLVVCLLTLMGSIAPIVFNALKWLLFAAWITHGVW